MIKALIFDFGNVFINLDLEGFSKNALQHFKLDSFSEDLLKINMVYEQGLISTHTFLKFYAEKFPEMGEEDLIGIWNHMLKDFPKHRLDFITELKKTSSYKLILLSNTNEIHMDWIEKNIVFLEAFKSCFDAFYLSHEIHLRKPDDAIYDFVLNQHQLNANDCLFIDDNLDNILAAKNKGLAVWHIDPKTDDVSQLFHTNQHLF